MHRGAADARFGSRAARRPDLGRCRCRDRRPTPRAVGSGSGGGDGGRRIVTDTPLSLKQQLKQVELAKGAEKPRALKPLPRTKFRQRKPADRGDGEAASESPQSLAETHTLENREKRLGQAQLLIIDGYNVCGCWPKLKEHFRRGDIERSRNMLIEELAFFQDVKILAVFDAATATRPVKTQMNAWLTVVYTSDADEYIDEYVPRDREVDICVVTSDNLTRSLAGTAGARLMSSLDFVSHVERQKAKNDKEIKVLSLKDQQRGTLRFALKEDARNRLLHMRQSLPQHVPDQPPPDAEAAEEDGASEGGKGKGSGASGADADGKEKRGGKRRKGGSPATKGGAGTMRFTLKNDQREKLERLRSTSQSDTENGSTATAAAAAATNLFVGSLPRSVDGGALRTLFSNFGEVTSAKIITDRKTGKSKGFGFVTMPKEDARAAMEALDGYQIEDGGGGKSKGRKISVKVAKPK